MVMFNEAKDLVINGGVFVSNVDILPSTSPGETIPPNDADVPSTILEDGLRPLIAKVATNAFLNAGGRADEVRCYPGTREEVIGKLEKWIADKNPDRKRMMWLSAPAGAGKSAIFQTVVERRRIRSQHTPRFFFFRGDPTRNSARTLVATLAYQLRMIYRSLDGPIVDRLTVDPLVCRASIEDQFRQLISSPIDIVSRDHPLAISWPIIFIIDGLDECEDKNEQESILFALHSLVHADHTRFLVLVASRVEPHLVMSFNKVATSVDSIFLDDKYKPQDDIRRFVVAKFDEIKKTHHFAATLSKDWPTQADIEAITNKSSGQFIYAATVMRFIQYSSESPVLSLGTILEMRPSISGHNPLAQLDAVYSHILSKAQNIQEVKFILCLYFIAKQPKAYPVEKLVQFLGHTAIEVESLFADLGAIIQVKTSGSRAMALVFYHASFEDYLKNESRSGIYHVNVQQVIVELTSVCLQKVCDKESLERAIWFLTYAEQPTPELTKYLLNASTHPITSEIGITHFWVLLINAIHKLYYPNNKAQFKAILQSWICFAYTNKIDLVFSQNTNLTTSWYYNFYCTTEWIKYALGLYR